MADAGPPVSQGPSQPVARHPSGVIGTFTPLPRPGALCGSPERDARPMAWAAATPMSELKANITANFVGSAWAGLMGLAFVPVYVHFLGIEAYGLIGVFATMLALLGLLDLGLSSTLNREMARLTANGGNAQEMNDLVRTLEIPYWGIGTVLGISVILLGPTITLRWVHQEGLSPETTLAAVRLMGVAVAVQWPISLYAGGLMGLQRQVALNAINIAMATARGVGSVAILWAVSPTIEAFFVWQMLVSVVNLALLAWALWRLLPHPFRPPRFRWTILRSVWRFAAGMSGIALLATVLMQMDKVILSRMLSLREFGYYCLASVVAMSLLRLVGPVFGASYPRLTSLVERGAAADVSTLYHQAAQLVSVLVLPAALILALFSREILTLWTRNPETVENTYLLVSILVTGTALNGLMNIPYALQLAYGWTRLALVTNIVSAMLFVPLLIVATHSRGAPGAAGVWLALNAGYVLIGIPLMHRRLLPAEKWRWYTQDVGRPLLAGVAVSLSGRYFIRSDWPPVLLFASICALSGATLLATGFAANRLGVNVRAKALLGALHARSS